MLMACASCSTLAVNTVAHITGCLSPSMYSTFGIPIFLILCNKTSVLVMYSSTDRDV